MIEKQQIKGASTASVASPAETKLAVAYESIRRREYELINRLLEVLPKIDGVGEEAIAQVRDALFHADHPYLIVFVGPFSSGKSSLINALLSEHDLLPVGLTPTTDRIAMLRWGEERQRMRSGDLDTLFYPSPLLQKVSFVDTPGLESIFQTHEAMTRRFLHRSDTVLLVMLATQAMTARNAEYLRILKTYDKTVILVINQVDLLTDEEGETVRQYVLEQSHDALGYKPQVWMVSAKRAAEARLPDGSLDPAIWATSGLDQIERYVDEQLGDAARLRQKLQTPLQIIQHVQSDALGIVRLKQTALDQYASITQNIDQQMTGYRREQERAAREVTESITVKFTAASEGGERAIREMFALNRVLPSIRRGAAELTGLAGLLGRGGGKSYILSAFTSSHVLEPIDALVTTVDKLAPRLEGKDIQDIDDLVKYAGREIAALPENIQGKVIGTIRAPLNYDRSPLQSMRRDLTPLEEEARTDVTAQTEAAARNTLLYLAFWEALMVVLAIVVLLINPSTPEIPWLTMGIFALVVVLALLGLFILPLRGRMMANGYAREIGSIANRYREIVTRGASKQIDYGMQLRQEAVAPLTRLIEAQTTLSMEQLNSLQEAQTEIVKIEAELARFR